VNSRKTVAVIGQGYVGLPLSVAAVDAGWKVYGIDIDAEKIKSLKAGISYIEDIAGKDLQNSLKLGFIPTLDFEVLSQAEIVVICVPTPLGDDSATPNLTPLISAVEKIAEFAIQGTLIINESTSFPTTVRELIPTTVRRVKPDLELLFAVAPERVDPGNKKWSYKATPRLVAGLTEEASKLAISFYASFCEKVVEVATPEVAEFSKLLENSFRQVNIALVNELAPLARSIGINIFDVIEAAATKPYGFMPFWPGVGVGGHCIPVDPMYLSWFARKKEINLTLIDSAQAVNLQQPSRIAQLVCEFTPNLDSRILIIGLAYKSGSKDIRESPSLELLEILEKTYEEVQWWDEFIESWNGRSRSTLSEKYDLVVVTHPVFSESLLHVLSTATSVIDCTGVLNPMNNSTRI
jgi:UDP-N-acetyl-D-glucosamine dehydrogenase